MLFESFRKKDFVIYKGDKGKVVKANGDMLEILIFKNKGKTTEVHKDDPELEKMKRCVGQCDKEIIDIDGERQIYCYGCERVLTSKPKKLKKFQDKMDKKKKKKKKKRGIKA